MTQTPRKQILVVEDEADVATLLRARLESQGYHVHVVHTGVAAVSYAVEHQPDLVILDLMLPDIDGNKVAEEIRRLYHNWVVPVLMLTAKDKPVDKLRGFAHGADAYMTKPYDAHELLQTVSFLLGTAAAADSTN